MKFSHLFIVFCVSALFITSCKDDEPIDNTPYNFTAAVADYVPGTIDSVYVFQFGANMLGKTKIADNGDFSMTLLPPTRIAPINTENFSTGVLVSDKNAQVGDVIIMAGMKDGKVKGYIQKSDTATYILLNDSTVFEGYATMMYSDRPFTITGNETLQQIGLGDSAFVTYDFDIQYDLTFSKGWNEIIFQSNIKSAGKNKISVKVTYNNTSPANFKWRFFPETAALNAQSTKIQGLNLNHEEILQKTFRLK